MTEERRPPTDTRTGANRASPRRAWTAPKLTVIEVAEATEAGAPGLTDGGIFS